MNPDILLSYFLRAYSKICREGLRKTTKLYNLNSRSLGLHEAEPKRYSQNPVHTVRNGVTVTLYVRIREVLG
jgi:hypothetical protein